LIFCRNKWIFWSWFLPAILFAEGDIPPPIEVPVESVATPSSTTSSAPAKEEDENVIKLKRDTKSTVEAKVFSEAERRKTCAKFNGKYISVYGEVYKVDKCERHPVTDPDLLFRLQRAGIRFLPVEATEVAAIEIGQPISGNGKVSKRNCKVLDRHYVTQSYMDIYYVENCSKRLIPDYETFVDLKRQKGHNAATEVLALTAEEFEELKDGKEYSSVVDRKENSERPAKKGVDIIPVDEACKGVEGKVVSYYSRLYKIEKCRKRELDAEVQSRQFYRNPLKLKELTAEQWISLPDGKPMSKK